MAAPGYPRSTARGGALECRASFGSGDGNGKANDGGLGLGGGLFGESEDSWSGEENGLDGDDAGMLWRTTDLGERGSFYPCRYRWETAGRDILVAIST